MERIEYHYQPGNTESPKYICADNIVVYNVECFERQLAVIYAGDVSADEVYEILDSRYDEWMDDDDIYESGVCLEEYMLSGLDKIGINYLPVHLGED